MRKHLTIKKCLELLKDVELSFGDRQQLESLVEEFGVLGAIEYLKPLTWDNPGRNQHLADTHRKILEGLLERDF